MVLKPYARLSVIVLAALTGPLSLFAQQTARDAPAAAATGTASIAGTVVVNEPNGPPLRRALVSISMRTSTISSTRQTTTDEQGRFVFRNLPAGAYGPPNASKAGFVPSSYGESRPGGVGTPISLAEGQTLSLSLKLLRGAVISGTLQDGSRPVAQTSVTATSVRVVNGVRMPGTTRFGSGQTDDRGMYRIYGLPPGDYIVAATPRLASNAEIRLVTQEELQWATQQLQSGTTPSGSASTQAAAAEPPRPAQPLGYSPVYYPGTSDAKAATTVTVATGQERAGVDFGVAYVATARIEGMLLDAEGAPANGAQLNLVPLMDPSDTFLSSSPFMLDTMLMMSRPTVTNGRFSLTGIRPGRYTLFARAPARGAKPVAAPGPGRGGAPPMTMWAMADVTVEGRDVSGLELRLQPGLTVRGRLVFDPASGTPPEDMSRLNVRLTPAPTAGVTVAVNPPIAELSADGSFRFEGVSPGRYVVTGTLPGGQLAWQLRSARAGDVDAADVGVEVGPHADTPEIVLTFTTRMAELTGRLLDATGKPSSALSMFLFSVDPLHWSQRTRRIRPPTRAGTDGTFRFTNLLPGEYYLAALADFDQADIFRPEFLEQVAAAAMKITLAEGEKKAQDIRIAGGK